jgi:hypothetical protein
MVAGLAIVNDYGTTQVDETWRNMGFRQKMPVNIDVPTTSPPIPAGYGGQPYQLVVSGTASLLIACKATVLLPVMLHSYYDGANWTFNWLFCNEFGGVHGNETVEFYVFDVLPSGGFSNVGLEVFNTLGQRVFHSDMEPMRVGYGGAGVQPCNTGFSGAGGRVYAPLIMLNPIYGVNMGGVTGFRLHAHSLRASGSSIVSKSNVPLGAFGASGAYDNSGLYAAIDVTGLS